MNTGREELGAGQTAGLAVAGRYNGFPRSRVETEQYNGTAWMTEVGDVNNGRSP